MPPSFRFPPLREGNREGRAYSVPPACRGNLKEGVLFYTYFLKLWLCDRYYHSSTLIDIGGKRCVMRSPRLLMVRTPSDLLRKRSCAAE